MKKRKLDENKVGKWTFWVVIVAAVCIMTAFFTSVQAAEPAEEDKWDFTIVPYLWCLSVDGSTTVKGRNSDVNATFSDIVSNMNIGFMFDLEVRKDRLGFFLHPLYAQLDDDQTVSGVDIDVTADMFIGAFGVDYELGPYALGESSAHGAPAVTLRPYIGGRYTYMNVTVNAKNVRYIEGSEHWLDPIVGLFTTWDFTERWNFNIGGDIGGFGVGSEFAWSATGLFGYRFSLLGKDNANFLFGYRALYQDYKKGSGASQFEFDATMHGPVIGLSIRF